MALSGKDTHLAKKNERKKRGKKAKKEKKKFDFPFNLALGTRPHSGLAMAVVFLVSLLALFCKWWPQHARFHTPYFHPNREYCRLLSAYAAPLLGAAQ